MQNNRRIPVEFVRQFLINKRVITSGKKKYLINSEISADHKLLKGLPTFTLTHLSKLHLLGSHTSSVLFSFSFIKNAVKLRIRSVGLSMVDIRMVKDL